MSVTPDVARLAARLRPAVPPARPLKIFQWCASMEDGTYRYRIQIPGDELRRLGHEVRTGMQLEPWAIEEADIVIGQRICQTKPTRGWEVLGKLRRAARGQANGGLVYEVDDDLFNIDSDTNPLGRAFRHPQVQTNIRACVREADGVTVTTEPLAEIIRKIRGPGRDPGTVFVVPNAMPTGLEAVQRTRPPARATMYGWQGSTTHADDWAVARPAVAQVLAEDFTKVRLRFVGTHHLEGLPAGPKIDFQGWTTDLGEHYRRIADFDVTLAPLANTKFNRSKSALRVQESLALGVPVVASDVPAYRGWVDDDVTGFLVPASAARWVEAMRALQDPDTRAVMAAAGRATAARWSVDRMISRWLSAYRSLLPPDHADRTQTEPISTGLPTA